MRWHGLVLTLAGCFVIAGCTKASETSTTTSKKSTPTQLVKLTQAPAGSAERTVLALLRSVQLDAPAEALVLFHPRVREQFGAKEIVNALSSQAGPLQSARFKRETNERSHNGILISYLMTLGDESMKRYSFLLRKVSGQWAIVYDTFLSEALAYLAQHEVTLRPGKQSPNDAVAAGERAAAQYRGLLLRDGRTPGPGSTPRTATTTPPSATATLPSTTTPSPSGTSSPSG